MWKILNNLKANQPAYDKESQALIDDYISTAQEIGAVEEMKKTDGWQIVERNLRSQIRAEIYDKVKDDASIMAKLSLVRLTNTTTAQQILEEEISKFIE